MYGGGTGAQQFGQPQQYNWSGANQYGQQQDPNEYSSNSRQQGSYGSLGHYDAQANNYGYGLPAQDGSKPVHDMYLPSEAYFKDRQTTQKQNRPKTKTVSSRSSANNSKISKTSSYSRNESRQDLDSYEIIESVRQVKSEMQELERDLGYIFRGFASVVPFYDLHKTVSVPDMKTLKKKVPQSPTVDTTSGPPKKPNKYVQDFMEKNKLDSLDPLGPSTSKDLPERQPATTKPKSLYPEEKSKTRPPQHVGPSTYPDRQKETLDTQNAHLGYHGEYSSSGRPSSKPKKAELTEDNKAMNYQEPPRRAAKDLYKRPEMLAAQPMLSNASAHSFGEPTSFGNTHTQGFGHTMLQNTREEIGFDSGIQSIQGSQLSRASDKTTSKRKEEFEKFRQNFFADSRDARLPENRLSEGYGYGANPLEQREKMFTRGEGITMPKPGFAARKFK